MEYRDGDGNGSIWDSGFFCLEERQSGMGKFGRRVGRNRIVVEVLGMSFRPHKGETPMFELLDLTLVASSRVFRWHSNTQSTLLALGLLVAHVYQEASWVPDCKPYMMRSILRCLFKAIACKEITMLLAKHCSLRWHDLGFKLVWALFVNQAQSLSRQ